MHWSMYVSALVNLHLQTSILKDQRMLQLLESQMSIQGLGRRNAMHVFHLNLQDD